VGRGKVFWIDRHLTLTTRNGRLAVRQVKTVRFRTEKYFKQEFHLLGSEEEKTKMEPGEITFDFSFTLPIEIPSSYSDRYGTIEYFAKVVVDRPWAINIKSKKHFIVRNYMTLNNIPSGMEKIEKKESKNVCFWCCASGPITARCWLPKQAYVPGESISFSAEIENSSTRTMKGTRLKLIQCLKYHATSKTKTVCNTICSAKRPAFKREDSWSDFMIPIPPVLFSPFHFSNVIEIEYKIKFKVDLGTFSSDLTIDLPIQIGSNCPESDTYVDKPFSDEPIILAAHPSQIETGIGTADPSLPYPVDTVKPMSYGSNPTHPPPIGADSSVPDSSLAYPINSESKIEGIKPNANEDFLPPGPPRTGGYAYYPVPSAPIEDLRPIDEPVSDNESPHTSGVGSDSKV